MFSLFSEENLFTRLPDLRPMPRTGAGSKSILNDKNRPSWSKARVVHNDGTFVNPHRSLPRAKMLALRRIEQRNRASRSPAKPKTDRLGLKLDQ
jgi:hypothetical protein